MAYAYQVVAILLGGICIGVAGQTVYLGSGSGGRRTGRVLAQLALLEALYCVANAGLQFAPDSEAAAPWGVLLGISASFLPVVTAGLTDALEAGTAWLRRARSVALVFAWLSVVGNLLTVGLGLPVAFSEILTVPDEVNRYRPVFTAPFLAMIAFCSAVLVASLIHLIVAGVKRPAMRPVSVGSAIFLVSYVLDVLTETGLLDFFRMQPLGFSAVVVGSWIVLGRRHRAGEQQLATTLERLEEHRAMLLTAEPRLQQQKLASIGTLAAGVAHEINNPLQSIMNYATLLRRQVPVGGKPATFVDEVLFEASRAAGIVRDLLVFARLDVPERKPENARAMLHETLNIVRPTLEQFGVAVSIDLTAAPEQLICCRRQIQQVLLNLLSNAADALHERFPNGDPRKRVNVRLRRTTGDHAELSVEDQGAGIPEALRERVFEPFFTTKTSPDRTGLGLSISHGIVANHGGKLELHSNPGAFTRFVLTLPSVASPATQASASGIEGGKLQGNPWDATKEEPPPPRQAPT